MEMTRRKLYLIISLSIFFALFLTVGLYLLLSGTLKLNTSYNVDKYSDMVGWCDTSVANKTLSVDCKTLLLDIIPQEDGSSCFDVQVITKNKELKDISICEEGDTLTYTNEILEYKKLMPVGVVFTYNQKSILSSYSFTNVSFTKLDDTYVQGVVNEDIANLVTIDPTSTTIQNSVDFCPKPETLPSYVTDTNKQAYTEFYNKNILAKEEYIKGYLYGWDDSVIRVIFACDSAAKMGYTDIFNKDNIKNLSLVSKNLDSINEALKLREEFQKEDIVFLKEISLIYDSMYKIVATNNIVNLGLLDKLSSQITHKGYVNKEVLCGLYKIYSNLTIQDNFYNTQKEKIQEIFLGKSFICSEFSPDFITQLNLNLSGIYIKEYISIVGDNDLNIYLRCNNLTNVVNY